MILAKASLLEVVQRGAAGQVPGDFALMKKVQMSLERVSWFCGPAGEGAKNTVVTG